MGPADIQELTDADVYTTKELEPNPALKLDDDISIALQKMRRIEEITAELPGLDAAPRLALLQGPGRGHRLRLRGGAGLHL